MADSRTSAASLLHRLAIPVLAVLLLAAPPSGAFAAGNVLLSGESFGAGGRLAHGRHSFILTDKCNLELDDGAWQSDTAGRGSGCRLTLEGDGRLLLTSEDGAIVWVSSDGSDREGEHAAVLDPRGRVTVYSPAVWSASELGDKLGCLKGGQWDNCLLPGKVDHRDLLTSPLLLRQGGGGGHRLPDHHKLSCLDHGGKWDNCIINGGVPAAAGNVLFSGARRFRLRGGCGGGRCFLRLDNRGGLAVVDEQDRAVWTNNVRSTSQGEYIAVLGRDGAVAVYGPAVWSTGRGTVLVEHRQHQGASTIVVNRKMGGVKMVTDHRE